MTLRLTVEEARSWLVGQAGLRAVTLPPGAAGVRALLAERRCIQLDPLDRIGTNADLVAFARVDGLRRGDIHRHLYPGHAFEHFAKERCLLPSTAFPMYRDQAAAAPWWRLGERLWRLPAGVVDAVLAEAVAREPVAAGDLADQGRVEAIDWSGWKGTARAASMALEVLWTRCQVVVAGRARGPGGRVYDVPRRALPDHADAPSEPSFARWAVRERVEAAGLLATTAGAHWSMLADVRTSPLPRELVAEGQVELVEIAGSNRTYLAPSAFRDRSFPADDGRMRILGPLDPLMWNRDLVRHVFGFDYVWEVYKPAEKRRWGWYVCPLLHDGRLVGRLEAHVEAGEVVVDRLWREDPSFDDEAFRAAIARHHECTEVTRIGTG
jgi:uncharacterized protein YcaQ